MKILKEILIGLADLVLLILAVTVIIVIVKLFATMVVFP